jgi:predicted phosphodiesterase
VKATTFAAISDVHVPNQDPATWEIFLQVVEREHPSLIVVNGDFGEWAAFSQHGRDGLDRDSAEDEAHAQRKELARLRAKAPKARIIYTEGNHETRPYRWCLRFADQLAASFKIPNVLRLKELGIQYVDEDTKLQIGGLRILHGHQHLGMNPSKHHAARMVHRYGTVLYGHTHRPQMMAEEVDGGPLRIAYGGPSACKPRPNYTGGRQGVNDWGRGFVMGELSDRHSPAVSIVHVLSDRAYWAGRWWGRRANS